MEDGQLKKIRPDSVLEEEVLVNKKVWKFEGFN